MTRIEGLTLLGLRVLNVPANLNRFSHGLIVIIIIVICM